ncbi:hypothetical protein J2Z69_000313 [Paenibacillus shirakamiensis]|uniref:Uncharacterized protein n=1 Tax=Paenibacillus shirakamiensis TaxID=1265935 RepID=A0ABS4JC52_9BACL|nr:hypothetical protein [Paenibacillus shirakamiensis]
MIILFFMFLVIIICSSLFLIKYGPYVPYLMLYQSKFQSLIELSIRYLSGEEIPNNIQYISYDYFFNRVKYSVIFENLLLNLFI